MGWKTENMLVKLDTAWKVIAVMSEVALRAAIKVYKGRCEIHLYGFLLSWQHNKAKAPRFIRVNQTLKLNTQMKNLQDKKLKQDTH